MLSSWEEGGGYSGEEVITHMLRRMSLIRWKIVGKITTFRSRTCSYHIHFYSVSVDQRTASYIWEYSLTWMAEILHRASECFSFKLVHVMYMCVSVLVCVRVLRELLWGGVNSPLIFLC